MSCCIASTTPPPHPNLKLPIHARPWQPSPHLTLLTGIQLRAAMIMLQLCPADSLPNPTKTSLRLRDQRTGCQPVQMTRMGRMPWELGGDWTSWQLQAAPPALTAMTWTCQGCWQSDL